MYDNADGKPIKILLVEDNPGDADLAREALEESKIKNDLYVVDDGEKAMQFLYRQGSIRRYLGRTWCCLI